MLENEQVVPTVQKENVTKKQHKKKKSKDRNNDNDNDNNKRKHDHKHHNDSLTKTSKKRKIRDIIGNERNNESTTTTTITTDTTMIPATTSIETTPKQPSTSIPTSYQSASDSDSSDDDNDDNKNNPNKSKTKTTSKKKEKKEKEQKRGTLTQNRILPQLHYVYADGVDMKTQMKNRSMAYATIKVNRDYYISDSDEASDSDDDYDEEPHCEWHRKVYHRPEKVKEKVKNGEWNIKTGKFSLEELIRLEKRIKKIGRVSEEIWIEQCLKNRRMWVFSFLSFFTQFSGMCVCVCAC